MTSFRNAGRLGLAGASFLAAIAFAGPSHAAPIAPAGDAAYAPPAQSRAGRHGSVIWSRPLEGTMALASASRNRLVVYRSLGGAGGTVAVSGTVSIPQGRPPAGGWPVINWTHGTTGLGAICAPSRDGANGPEHSYIEKIATLLDGFVRAGYAVVASDYEGLGVAGTHPFLQGVPNARNALDMLRAARAIEPSIGTRFAVMGHSQGGHTDLFAAALARGYAPEFQLLGNLAFAPGSHIVSRLNAVRASPQVELALPYVLYVLQSYAQNHPSIDLAKILTPQAIAHLPELQLGCMTRTLTDSYFATAIAKEQFLPDPDLSAFLVVAAQNEPSDLRIPVPTVVMQGTADVTVLPADTDDMVRRLCASGNFLEYRRYPGADHNGSMAAGAADALAWMNARFRAEPVSANCPAAP
ncbi:lipase [Roseococcus sp. SYP-B2431]|uniref:lipase family protein n=1 Tax=Roseococcus sp. SYP-B2431 TaxID=2496640 RepID=UPI00103EBBAD|nr:lipase family protein [Roseococcus sp. SYP-B2431]TCI00349.1 lipase [Roseococcus sp. SYP-B2431]